MNNEKHLCLDTPLLWMLTVVLWKKTSSKVWGLCVQVLHKHLSGKKNENLKDSLFTKYFTNWWNVYSVKICRYLTVYRHCLGLVYFF